MSITSKKTRILSEERKAIVMNKKVIKKKGNLKVTLDDRGFSLWAKEEKEWHLLIDASSVFETSGIWIMKEKDRWNICLKKKRTRSKLLDSRYLLQIVNKSEKI